MAASSYLDNPLRESAMPSVSSGVHEPRRTPMRVARPLAWSLAIHLGLGGIIVLAGSVGPAPAPRAVSLDLQPVFAPAPPTPAPPAAITRPRPVRPPIDASREVPVPVPSAVPEEPAPPPQPLPPPRREVATAEPPIQSAPVSPQTSSEDAVSKAPELDRSGAPASRGAVSASSAVDAPPSGVPNEGATGGSGNPAVASRTPEVPAGGPIVRAARPRGGYQVRPVYPDAARRAGIQGTTLLRIHIEVDGRGDVTVARSAGHQALDEAAAEAVRRWRFEPALNSAGPVSMWAVVPVEFRISSRD